MTVEQLRKMLGGVDGYLPLCVVIDGKLHEVRGVGLDTREIRRAIGMEFQPGYTADVERAVILLGDEVH